MTPKNKKMKKCASLVKSLFSTHCNEQRAQQQTKYFKNVVKFHGLSTPEVKKLVFREVRDHFKKEKFSREEKLDFSWTYLLPSEYFCEKRLGLYVLEDIVHKLRDDEAFALKIIHELDEIVPKHVYDWGTCDTLSSIVGELIMTYQDPIVEKVELWKNAKSPASGEQCIWRRRLACVSFLKPARKNLYKDTIYDICETVLSEEKKERFVHLGAGWVLRELSVHEEEKVLQFTKIHYDKFLREGLRYVIEKMPDSKRQMVLKRKYDEPVEIRKRRKVR